MDDLKLIKKHYGEDMMHLCRELFPSLIEKGVLFDVLAKSFDYSKHLYEDIINEERIDDFKNFIFSKTDIKVETKKVVDKTPSELLSEVGYNLFECKSEEDIQKFRKYFKKDEELCTFNGGRLKRCYVFFAVKKNVNEIKRENFKNPNRQDEYGTSVISIQFSKGDINTLSIKNRYNHTVNNPDSTFSNNLDNIIEGLTESFNKTYNLNNVCNNKTSFELNNYVQSQGERFYKYNYEVDNEYYCINNKIMNRFGVVFRFDKERFILFDIYVLDLKEKKLSALPEKEEKCSSFINSIGEIKKIEIKNNKEEKTKDILINDDVVITIDKFNRIISYKNSRVEEIEPNFLIRNYTLESIELTNVKKIRENFLMYNKVLNNLLAPNLEFVGDKFLCENRCLDTVSLPNIKIICGYFLYHNNCLKSLSLPKVDYIGKKFMYNNEILEKLDLPLLEEIGDDFLYRNKAIKNLSLPNVKFIEECFLYNNEVLGELDLPKLIKVGSNFMVYGKKLKKINVPNLKTIDNNFLVNNTELKNISLPNVETIYNHFLSKNNKIKKIDFPKIGYIGYEFMLENTSVRNVNLPQVEEIWKGFLDKCTLDSLYAPNLKWYCSRNLPIVSEKKVIKLR